MLLAITLVLATVGALIVAHRPSAATGGGGGGGGGGGQSIAAETAARNQALAWVASQVGQDIAVACDPVICSDLARRGFPPGNLTVVPATAPDPYGSEVVIATASIRSQFGARLAAVYAPAVIASFGTGTDRIDIRVIAPRGAAAFRAALGRDLRARQYAGAQLVQNPRVTVSALARNQLKAGQVDLRLVTAIVFMTHPLPVTIVGFGSLAPGADPWVPLRYAYLAESNAAAHLTSARYVQALLGIVQGWRPPYVPNNVATISLPGGQVVLRIEFPAPSPLDLPLS